MDSKERALLAIEALKQEYPDAICSLVYTEPLQLLIATRLAAQCTDARVNMVTPALFERFKTAEDFAEADISEVEKYIHSCGLYKTKARDIVAMCQMLVSDFGGVVPDTIEKLIKLPGVGRKTANLVDFCHRLVLHGRAVCDARKPKCDECCMNGFCEYYSQNKAI